MIRTAEKIEVALNGDVLEIDIYALKKPVFKMMNIPITITRSNKMEKDYSLLRPFDREAAKRGEKICWHEDGLIAEYIGPCGMHDENDICIKWIETRGLAELGHYVMHESSYFRMAPLTWVKEKPVYPGDVLYTETGRKVIVERMYDCNSVTDGEWVVDCRYATWQKPKTKREGWIEVDIVKLHESKEDAERNRSPGCTIMFAQWEE